MNFDLQQFASVYFEETDEHLADMEALLLGLEPHAPDLEALNGIFRAAHSIKGASGMFNFSDVVAVTHVLENLLDRLRSGRMQLQPDQIDLFLEARDLIAELVAAHKAGAEQGPDTRLMVSRLNDCLNSSAAPLADPGGAWGLFAPLDDAVTAALNEIADDSFGFFDDAPGAPVAAETAYGLFEDAPGLAPPADDSFGLFEDAPGLPAAAAEATVAQALPALASSAPAIEPSARVPATASKGSAAAEGEANTIRVPVRKIDSLINMVGELVITQAMLAQEIGGHNDEVQERLQQILAQLDHNTRDLQETVMSIRMLPISFVFSRFPRLVRDVGTKLGKQLDLVLSGETTELDKSMIERLIDPLTHIVRNSIDHGIETPDERRASGKSERGRISLSAFHQGGRVVVEISDDGRGLNRERILAKAREQGMAVHDAMADSEVWQLIFMPGFSTAEQVTDLSGRGVGMDVVRRNVQSVGGRIDIQSVAGAGTRISLRLPLTLAIVDGMIVQVEQTNYVIPLAHIVESLQPSAADVRGIGGDGRVVRVRGDYLPLFTMHGLMGHPPAKDGNHEALIIILEADGTRFGLLVDRLLGQQQVVIKSLEHNFRRLDGIAGATIMGDGSVALIVDVEQLPAMAATMGNTT
ncbi:MAG: chemotaxis protein CheA [Gammaproteobacteria bacterium]|nr:chemotaxis protein CheA [Gammaproteobacteria bacterium]